MTKHLNQEVTQKLRELLSKNPNISMEEIQNAFSVKFEKKQLQAISGFKSSFIRIHDKKHFQQMINIKSNLSPEVRNQVRDFIANDPAMTVMDIARKLGVEKDHKKVQTIHNIKNYIKHYKSKKIPTERVIRSYHRKQKQLIYYMRGTYTTTGLPAKAKVIIRQLEEAINNSSTLRVIKLAGKEQINEIRELELSE
jgi:hypothetical protein